MKKYFYKISFLILGIFIAAGTSYLNAWTGPTQTPPAGNVSAPVNLSSLSQVKLGGLGVASLLSTGAIGASQYCDANGQNCATPPFLTSGSLPAAGSAGTACTSSWFPNNRGVTMYSANVYSGGGGIRYCCGVNFDHTGGSKFACQTY